MKHKPSSSSLQEALVGGIVLMLFGGVVWGAGDLIHNSTAILIGVLSFVGGILLFFGGITRVLDKL